MDNTWCQFPNCDNEAVTTVLVSYDENTVVSRSACYSCSEVYAVGVQHGQCRAIRQTRASAATRPDDLSGAAVEKRILRSLKSTDDPAEANFQPEGG